MEPRATTSDEDFLEELRRHRAELRESMSALEDALAAPAVGDRDGEDHLQQTGELDELPEPLLPVRRGRQQRAQPRATAVVARQQRVEERLHPRAGAVTDRL